MKGSITVRADLEELDSVLGFVEDSLKGEGFDKGFISAMKLIADELFANIAMYAYNGAAGEAVISLDTAAGGGVMLIFSDKGIRYNPLEREDPDVTLPAEERSEGGLGIYLVKSMADRVEYEYSGGSNIVRVWKER